VERKYGPRKEDRVEREDGYLLDLTSHSNRL
jgi:hypothetical protein